MVRTTRRPRFKLYGFNEICHMSPAEWDEECRHNNADFQEHCEEAYIRECIEARVKGLKTCPSDYSRD
jgi:hypothetical protein